MEGWGHDTSRVGEKQNREMVCSILLSCVLMLRDQYFDNVVCKVCVVDAAPA